MKLSKELEDLLDRMIAIDESNSDNVQSLTRLVIALGKRVLILEKQVIELESSRRGNEA